MKEELGQKSQIIVDNATSHPQILDLIHMGIQVYFLPTDNTLLIQPLD